MLPLTHWIYSDKIDEAGTSLVRELGIHPLIARILTHRGITSPEEAKKFIFPSLGDLHNPFVMQDMEKGVDRTIDAVVKGEHIVVYGDYDADGITATVALVKFLQSINGLVSFYIPNRINEGYGLNNDAIDRLEKRSTKLIITVDCGSSDRDEVAHAGSRGIDVIVLDHHEVPDILPDAQAVINPHRHDCAFPFKHLAGVGVVFNFLIALRGKLRNLGFWDGRDYPNLREYLDLVALGTIGDLVPLVDENRIFARFGIDLINENRRTGISALRTVSGYENRDVDSEASSFSLIPRINAAGRIGSSDNSVQLLLTHDKGDAFRSAELLDLQNRERQEMERLILEEILEEIESRVNMDETYFLVFASPRWHPGVIGIVASKLVNRYYRPAFLISLQDGIGKGSGRSIAEFNLYDGLKNTCESLLLSYGGHRFAAGITIREQDISSFAAILNEETKKCLGGERAVQKTTVDARCSLDDIDHDLVSQIAMLSPFGNGNPEPLFMMSGAKILSATVVGNNHLKMWLGREGKSFDAIWFNNGHLFQTLTGATVDVVFSPQINDWNGGRSIQLKIRDISIA